MSGTARNSAPARMSLSVGEAARNVLVWARIFARIMVIELDYI